MITKSALVLIRGEWPDAELLLLKEHSKKYWLFPGGKQNPGETIEEALVREIHEELSAEVKEVEKIGVVEGATPEGTPLVMHLFRGAVVGKLVASSEISTLRWIRRAELDTVHTDLTPITLNKVFPYLYSRRIW
jgi:8-oxo-dGTP pyrophosphatase MutT (NUDIX family)